MRAYWELPALVLLFVLGVISGTGTGCRINNKSQPAVSVVSLEGPRYVVVKFVEEGVASCWIVNGTVKKDGPNRVVLTYKDGRIVTSIGKEMTWVYLPKPTQASLRQTYGTLVYYRINFPDIENCMR